VNESMRSDKLNDQTHTPGPWIWREKSGSLHRAGEKPYAYGDVVLAPSYEYDTGADTKVSDADAWLIASAPDLLSALLNIIDYPRRSRLDDGENVQSMVQIAKDAIARSSRQRIA